MYEHLAKHQIMECYPNTFEGNKFSFSYQFSFPAHQTADVKE